MREGHAPVVRYLLERGADPMAAGAEWATPLAWVQRAGWEDIAVLLQSGAQSAAEV